MPSSTPRSVDAVVSSILATIATVNPRLDVRKGPLAVVVWALANELARSEEFSSYLQILYSFDNADRIENSDLLMIGSNYGKDPDIGRAARTQIHVFRYARPELGQIYPVNIGTLLSTPDGRFVYGSISTAVMNGNYADTYYDSTEQRYEIPVLSEAVATGADYDLPPQSITRILGGLDGFDGCVNKSYVRRQGNEAVPPVQFIRQIQNTLQGVGTDLAGKIVDIIQDNDPTGYDDIAFVTSLDFIRFRRNKSLHGVLGYDIYVITDSVEEDIQDGIAQGGEITIPLDKGPVLAVQWVTVNGVTAPFSVNLDTDPQFQGSPKSLNSVVLSTPLLPLQTYQISYIYYDFVYSSNSLFQARSGPFGADTLVRRARPVEVLIDASVVTTSSADRQQVLTDLTNFTSLYLRDPTGVDTSRRHFVTLLDPSDYIRSARAGVSGLDDLKLSGFIRIDSAYLPVERIIFDGATEYPMLSVSSNIV
jgi:hypothetical protein